MDKENPLISIIIRTKDKPLFLKRAFQSVIEQTYRPLEVIVIDNGHSVEIEKLKDLSEDISFKHIKLEEDKGQSYAGNIGIENAAGKYIGFLEEGNAYYPEHIALLAEFLEVNNQSAVHSNGEIIYHSYNLQNKSFIEIPIGDTFSSGFSANVLFFEDCIPITAFLFRRDLLISIGGFDENIDIFHDWELLIRISSQIPVNHINATTFKDARWDKDDTGFEAGTKIKENYIKVLQKHSDKRTEDAAYRYYVLSRGIFNLREKKIVELQKELQRLKESAASTGHVHTHANTLKAELDEKNRYIQEIQGSLGWKFLTFYRGKIKSLFVPPNSRRERFYNLLLKGISVVLDRGFFFFLKKVKSKVKGSKAKVNITKENYDVPVIKDDSRENIDAKVSVVIPTQNAGNEFRYTLEKLNSQKGVREIELIILDSSSHDDTVSTAKKFGARIFSISPADFNHGATRNLGAEKASGEFIIFMSQDAVPAGDLCISRILKEMKKDEKIAAATVKQIPRSNADLFTSWQLWFYNNKLMEYKTDRLITLSAGEIENLSAVEKRKFMQLDNVFSCFRKDIFDRFKFKPLSYGEDIDIGMRLVNGGYKLLFLSSAGVIHSHNRMPLYFLKRSYIDTKTILKKLSIKPIDWNEIGFFSFEQLFKNLYSFYRKLGFFIYALTTENNEVYTSDSVLSMMKVYFDKGDFEGSVCHIESGLDRFFGRITEISTDDYDLLKVENGIFLNQYLDFLKSFFEYLQTTGRNISYENMNEFISYLHKLFAWTAGSNAGNFEVFYEKSLNMKNAMDFEHLFEITV